MLESSEAWCTPYLIQLAGEYVVEIADDVAAGIVKRDLATLAAFASENPDYLATFARRVTSIGLVTIDRLTPNQMTAQVQKF